jgi:hypothetical protein
MAFAQSDHKIEVTGNYSYIHANPQNNNIIPTFSLNGGGGSGAFHFSKYIGIVAALRISSRLLRPCSAGRTAIFTEIYTTTAVEVLREATTTKATSGTKPAFSSASKDPARSFVIEFAMGIVPALLLEREEGLA